MIIPRWKAGHVTQISLEPEVAEEEPETPAAEETGDGDAEAAADAGKIGWW